MMVIYDIRWLLVRSVLWIGKILHAVAGQKALSSLIAFAIGAEKHFPALQVKTRYNTELKINAMLQSVR
jgi:hypothetical protein